MHAILDKVPSPPTWSTTLLIDAMYFHSAKSCCEAAKMSLKGIGKARKAFADLRNEEAEILDRYDGDSWKAYDDLEPIYIQMDGAEHDIGAAYGPYFQNIALTHILCATTAEAHINLIAKGRLKGKFRDNFEKISIEGKWLFLPKILGKTTFNQGSEPFQSFGKLIKYRNELVHYNGRKESWESFEQSMPKFLDKLGLSLRKARKSIRTVREMILKLSKMIDEEPPYWLREGYDDLPKDIVTNFFEVNIEK
ncbi:MAG: hypothetical protein KAV87_39255 [Desulfobacteraceae bacterium]|nr:hypothetical protein [Desulfobacteraceae bacterium]